MPLRNAPMTYIRFFVFLTPIILPCMAILNSAFESNIRGLLYVAGLSTTMFLGSMIARYVQHNVPGTGTGTDFIALIDPACTIVQGADSTTGWGSRYSLPGPHALLLAFTTTYLLFPMFINGNINFGVIGALTFMMSISAWMRTSAPMNCISPTDVIAGWGTGFIFGTIFFFIFHGIDPSFTYFSNSKSDKQECKLDNKAFRCKSKKKAN
jgi:membrane-associated phospholipid phosphatase